MAATIIATVGAADANSFGTVAEADAYHDTVLHEDAPWTSDATKKIKSLIMAQQQITALVEWTGYPTTLTQALPWPRTGMLTRNGLAFIPDNVIPDEVKWAQFELARLLAVEDRTEDFDIGTMGITHLRAGPVTIKFRDILNAGPGVLAAVVWNLLVPSWYCYIIGMPSLTRDLKRA